MAQAVFGPWRVEEPSELQWLQCAGSRRSQRGLAAGSGSARPFAGEETSGAGKGVEPRSPGPAVTVEHSRAATKSQTRNCCVSHPTAPLLPSVFLPTVTVIRPLNTQDD